MTLLELVVVLALLGLATALVIPALSPPAVPVESFERIARASRRAAIERSQQLQLVVSSTGSWTLRTAQPAGAEIAKGQLPAALPSGAATLVISPLGACAVASANDGFPAWDAARCGPVERATPSGGTL